MAQNPTWLIFLSHALFPILVALLFKRLPVYKAIIYSCFIGYLFLPLYSYHFVGLPDVDKPIFIGFTVVVAVLSFDSTVFRGYRFHYFDLVPLAISLLMVISAVYNGLGAYAGLHFFGSSLLTIVAPYLLGRIYLVDLSRVLELAKAFVLFGLIYVPLCLIEIRLSPFLHYWIYGYHQHSFAQQVRLGGYRPMVFLGHGLIVAKFMSMSCLSAFILWKGSSVKKIGYLPISWTFFVLLVTLVLCKSLNGYGLFAVGLLGYLGIKYSASRLLYVGLVLLIPFYLGLRLTTDWNGARITHMIEKVYNADRAASLYTRISYENMFKKKVGYLNFFGTGNSSWRGDEEGNQVGLVDSTWLIYYGVFGVFGLCSLYGFYCVPCLLASRFFAQNDAHQWKLSAPLHILGLIVLLEAMNSLLNSGIPIMVPLSIGALVAQARLPMAALAARAIGSLEEVIGARPGGVGVGARTWPRPIGVGAGASSDAKQGRALPADGSESAPRPRLV
jgi:hypothetical protein